MNSSESTIFSKRRLLFGLNRVKSSDDTVLVVEGYFDVLTLHQAGFTNTVGLLGTELSAEQVKILERLAHNVILIFDADAGGKAAILKCLRIPLQNLTVKGVLLPEGDPDEFIRRGRVTEFQRLIERARGIREIAVEIIGQRAKEDSVEHLTEDAARIAAEIPDGMEANLFAEEAARTLNVPAWVLQEKTQARREKKEKIAERKRALERFIVNELLQDPSLRDPEKLNALKDLFEDGEEKRILVRQLLKQ